MFIPLVSLPGSPWLTPPFLIGQPQKSPGAPVGPLPWRKPQLLITKMLLTDSPTLSSLLLGQGLDLLYHLTSLVDLQVGLGMHGEVQPGGNIPSTTIFPNSFHFPHLKCLTFPNNHKIEARFRMERSL